MRILLAAVQHIISNSFTCEGVTVALVYFVGASDDWQCYCEYVKYSSHFFLLKLPLLAKRGWPSAGGVCLLYFSNALPLRVLPLVKEGEFLFSFQFFFLVSILGLQRVVDDGQRHKLNIVKIEIGTIFVQVSKSYPMLSLGQMNFCYNLAKSLVIIAWCEYWTTIIIPCVKRIGTFHISTVTHLFVEVDAIIQRLGIILPSNHGVIVWNASINGQGTYFTVNVWL